MRLPLAFNLGNRTSSLAKYSRLLNCFVEVKGDPKNGGVTRVIKRPAMNSAFQAQTPGQTLYAIPNVLFSIANDNLTINPPTLAKTQTYTTQPVDSYIGEAMTPVVVTVEDIYGITSVGYTQNVTISLANNPNNATLSGTTTVAASGGVATFSNLLINAGAHGYTLKAVSQGLSQAISSSFNINTAFVYTVQPAPTVNNVAFTAEVKVEDGHGNIDTTYTGAVTMRLGVNPSGATLYGNLTVAAVSGVATFSNLLISKDGTGYTLIASADGYADKTSNAFNIPQSPRISASSAYTINRTSAAFTGASSTCAHTTFAYFVEFASTSGAVIIKVGNAYLALSAATTGNSILGTMYNNAESDGSTFNVTAANYHFPIGSWACVLISWNALANWQVYVNDVALTFSTSGTSQPTVDLSKNFGNRGSVAISNGCEAQYWFDQTAAMDFSNVTNRRKFVTAGVHPVDLGTSGQIPTGSSPLLYAQLFQGTPLINLGTGGNYDSSSGTSTTCLIAP